MITNSSDGSATAGLDQVDVNESATITWHRGEVPAGTWGEDVVRVEPHGPGYTIEPPKPRVYEPFTPPPQNPMPPYCRLQPQMRHKAAKRKGRAIRTAAGQCNRFDVMAVNG